MARAAKKRTAKKAAQEKSPTWKGGVKVMASIKGVMWLENSYGRGERQESEIYLDGSALMADVGCRTVTMFKNAVQAKPVIEFMANCYGWTLTDKPKPKK